MEPGKLIMDPVPCDRMLAQLQLGPAGGDFRHVAAALGSLQSCRPQLFFRVQRLLEHLVAGLPEHQNARHCGLEQGLAEAGYRVAPVHPAWNAEKWPSSSKLTVRATARSTATTGSALTGMAPL